MSDDQNLSSGVPVQAEILPMDPTSPHGLTEIINDSEFDALPQKLQRVIATLRAYKGNISNTCSFFRIDRSTFYEWKKSNRIFAKLVDEVQDARIDNAESVLDELIDAKEPSAVFFLLKMHKKARERGYVDSQRVEHEGAVPVVDIEKEKRKARQLLEEQKDE
jgi:hypothetical protein